MTEDELLTVILNLSQNVDNFLPLHSADKELHAKAARPVDKVKPPGESSDGQLSPENKTKTDSPPGSPV